MEFFKGLIFTTLIFYGFCGMLIYFSKEYGIKRGKELAMREASAKLDQCNKLIVGNK